MSRVDVRLELGALGEQVTVEASSVALQTDKSDVRSEVTSQAVGNLPLAAYRNFQNLIDLVPGATPANFQNSVGSTPARALTTNINGTARNSNNARVDGATNVFIWLPHHMVYVPPVESISTVNITTGSFDAEQGMAGGAAVTVATKSGTNEFHGVAFHYHDNHRLKTRNFFLPPTSGKAKSIFNIFGGTLGGPDHQGQAILLRQLRRDAGACRHHPPHRRRSHRRHPGRRLQRTAGYHLRSEHGQSGRLGPATVRRQSNSGQSHQSDQQPDPEPGAAAESCRGHPRARSTIISARGRKN